MSPARAAGYRLLGPRFDYLLHLRPVEWPIMAAHTALGYLLAVGLHGAAKGEGLQAAVLGIVLWVACLNGGTLALNSAFDRDEGDIAYLRNPPPPPRRLAAFSLGLMAAGFAASFALPPAFRVLYAVCVGLSVIYSVPPFRLKAVAGADWLINMVGFGTLTPLAGWAATARPIDTRSLVVLVAFCPLFAALYPLTQLYQLEEDARRGDRTLALMLGAKRSLDVALIGVAVAFALFGVGGHALAPHVLRMALGRARGRPAGVACRARALADAERAPAGRAPAPDVPRAGRLGHHRHRRPSRLGHLSLPLAATDTLRYTSPDPSFMGETGWLPRPSSSAITT